MDSNRPTVTTELRDGLTFQVLREPASGSEAWVMSEVGANCVSFVTTIDGVPLEVIRTPPSWETFRNRPTFYGAAVLFPFPGRIRQGRFSFDGRDYQLPLNEPELGNAIHGCVSHGPWTLVGTESSAPGGAAVTYQIGTDSRPELIEQYPFPFRLTMTIRLRRGQLSFAFLAENLGERPMPIGLGLHPYFPLPLGSEGTADECEFWIDAPYYWEQQGIMPIAPSRPVAESVDLRAPRSLRALASVGIGGPGKMIVLSHSQFSDRSGPAPSDHGISWGLRDPRARREVIVEADAAFPASVVFVPESRDKISFEPHSGLPNAFNLANEGHIAGRTTLSPREFWRASARISARALPEE